MICCSLPFELEKTYKSIYSSFRKYEQLYILSYRHRVVENVLSQRTSIITSLLSIQQSKLHVNQCRSFLGGIFKIGVIVIGNTQLSPSLTLTIRFSQPNPAVVLEEKEKVDVRALKLFLASSDDLTSQ